MADHQSQAEPISAPVFDHDRSIDTAALNGMEFLTIGAREGQSVEEQSLGASQFSSILGTTGLIIEAQATRNLPAGQRNQPSLQGMPVEIREIIFAHGIVDLFLEKWGPRDEFDECARNCLLNIFKVDPRFEVEALPFLLAECVLVVDESRDGVPRFKKVMDWITKFNLGRHVKAIKYRHLPPLTYPPDSTPESPHIMDLLALCPNAERITITTIYDVFVILTANGFRADTEHDYLDTMNFSDLIDLPQLEEINLRIEGRTSYLKGQDPDFMDDLCSVPEAIKFLEYKLCSMMSGDANVKVHLWTDFGYEDEKFVVPQPRSLIWTVHKDHQLRIWMEDE